MITICDQYQSNESDLTIKALENMEVVLVDVLG